MFSTFEEDEPHIAKIQLMKEANFDVPGHVNRRKSGICGSNSPHAVTEGRPKKTVYLTCNVQHFVFFQGKNGTFFSFFFFFKKGFICTQRIST